MNHGHNVAIPREDIEAGVEKTYSIRADADHEHTVTLTAAHFAELAAGGSVAIEASVALEHSHTCVLGCGEPLDPGGGGYYG